MVNEHWKPISEYTGYFVSDLGNIKSEKGRKPKMLNGRLDKDGYRRVHLSQNGKSNWVFVHRLVAVAFIPNPNNYPCVNHKDEVKLKNEAENLEWCDVKYNNNYGTRLSRAINKRVKTVSQPIIGINIIDGSVVRFASANEAGRNGFKQSNIFKCLKGQAKTHHGYKWQYAQKREKS